MNLRICRDEIAFHKILIITSFHFIIFMIMHFVHQPKSNNG